jgi:hypothetical protein
MEKQSPYLCALWSCSIRMSSADDSAAAAAAGAEEAEHSPLRASPRASAPRRVIAAAISAA